MSWPCGLSKHIDKCWFDQVLEVRPMFQHLLVRHSSKFLEYPWPTPWEIWTPRGKKVRKNANLLAPWQKQKKHKETMKKTSPWPHQCQRKWWTMGSPNNSCQRKARMSVTCLEIVCWCLSLTFTEKLSCCTRPIFTTLLSPCLICRTTSSWSWCWILHPTLKWGPQPTAQKQHSYPKVAKFCKATSLYRPFDPLSMGFHRLVNLDLSWPVLPLSSSSWGSDPQRPRCQSLGTRKLNNCHQLPHFRPVLALNPCTNHEKWIEMDRNG